MPYAILHRQTIQDGQHLGQCFAQFPRTQDRERRPQPHPQQHHHGAQNTREVVEGVKARLATVPTVRKNAVLAVEYFIGMSPEFVKEGGNIKGISTRRKSG